MASSDDGAIFLFEIYSPSYYKPKSRSVKIGE